MIAAVCRPLRGQARLALALALACSACVSPPQAPAAPAHAPEAAASQPCTGAATQRELSACWAHAATQVETDVDRRHRQLSQALQAREGVPAQALADAQAAWERYRDAACEVHRQRVAGGSIQPTALAVCRWRLAVDRLTELDRLSAAP